MSEKKLVRVAIALVWMGSRLLITRRPRGAHLAELWEFPGGKIELNESVEAAAEREVLEEVGLTVRSRSQRPSIEHSYSDRDVVLYPVNCEWLRGAPELKGVADARWVLPAELIGYEFPAANRELINELAAATDREQP